MKTTRRSPALLTKVAVCAVVLLGGLAGFAMPANADDYGYPGGTSPLRYPDSADHWYCFRNVASGTDQNRIHTAMGILDSQTEMYDVYTATCGTSTDAAWEFVGWCQIPGGSGCPLGRTVCEQHVFWGVCDRFGVYIDATTHYFSAIDWVNAHGGDVGYSFNVNLNMSVCHELGHSAGLHHITGPLDPPVRCMNSAWIAPTNGWEELNYVMYSDHHVWHINNYI